MSSFDHYEPLRELGSGGMGTVFLAHDPSLDRQVAVKVLSGWSASPELLERFTREAQVVASLRHPGIVGVHAVGTYRGSPCIVMDLIEGESLQARLKRSGPLPPDEAARVLAQVASTLRYAHGQGVLHRDLKPANVLLAGGSALLVDFGLAKDLSDTRESLTRTGQSLGTPAYMSPEQANGDKAAIGPPTDVYGLGATLYAALTGEPPFSGVAVVNILSKVLQEPPAPPRSLRREIPRRLEALCLKCLAKAPGQRYEDAGQVEAELRRFLSGEPLGTARRRPLLAVGAAGVGVALALFASTALWPRTEAPETEPGPLPPAGVRPTPASDPVADPRTLAKAGKRLRSLLRLEPRERYAALGGWVAENPAHPGAARAREAREQARCEFPSLVLELSGRALGGGAFFGAPTGQLQGAELVLCGETGVARYDAASGEELSAWRPDERHGVQAIAPLASRELLLVGASRLYRWRHADRAPSEPLAVLEPGAGPLAVSPSGRFAALGREGKLVLIPLRSPAQQRILPSPGRGVTYEALTFPSDERLVAFATPEQGKRHSRLEAWKLPEGTLTHDEEFPGHARDLKPSPDGERLAVAFYAAQGLIRVVSRSLEVVDRVGKEAVAGAGEVIGSASVRAVGYSADGRLLHFLASDHPGDRIMHGTWDLEQRRELLRIGHPGAPLPVMQGLFLSEDRRWGLIVWPERAEVWGLPQASD